MRAAAGFLAALLAACGEGSSAATVAELDDVVFGSTYPVTWMAQRIGGADVNVECAVPAGRDPEFWQPSREVIAALQRARLVVINGAGYEKWVQHASLPTSRLIDTGASLAGRLLTVATVTHSHGTGGAHTHEGVDPHVWLDPGQARAQADAIAAALKRAYPGAAAKIDQNVGAVHGELDELAMRCTKLAAAAAAAELFSAHESLGYLGRRLGVTITNLELAADALAEVARARLRDLPRAKGVRVVLWNAAPAEAVAAELDQKFGLKSVVFELCAAVPADDRDYIAVMRANFDRLGAALGAGN